VAKERSFIASSRAVLTVATRFHSLIFLNLFRGPAYRAGLQAMDEPLPQWPTLFFDLVLPSRSKYLFLNFWIADTHVENSKAVSLEGPNGSSGKKRFE
jgi:hypothetical protein